MTARDRQFRIPYQPPYDWQALLAFLGARAIPGVERIEDNRYQRTFSINGKSGSFSVARVRRMFDVGADPSVIAEQLSGDVLLKRACAAHPGIRTPGAWDPFELTVRAILGQQISVAAATTIAGRVAARWGTPLEAANGLTHLFPTPSQLAGAPLEEAGIISTRATTLRAVARAVIDGSLVFDGVSTGAMLRSIRGIGDWTTQYVLMRALNEPDAFPSGDLVLKRMAGGCTAAVLERRSHAWRPWRAYAVMLLWQAARDEAPRQINTGRAPAVRTKIVACESRLSAGRVSEKARSSAS